MGLIECCLSNVSSDARVVLNESDHEVRERFCLDRCGQCYDEPFLVIDGDLQTGDSHRAILRSFESQSPVDPK